MTDIFSCKNPTDPTYIRVSESEDLSDVRKHMRDLWKEYAPKAEPQFLKKLGSEFHQRYWEMRLGCILVDNGYKLPAGTADGPDFTVTLANGEVVYVEATTVTGGQTDDAVPKIDFDAVEAEIPPTKRIVLRVQNSISEKRKQYDQFICDQKVECEAPYVIAISLAPIPRARVDDSSPVIAQACLGIGGLRVNFSTNGRSRAMAENREVIRKRSGTEIDTGIFRREEYHWLSGVLLSDVSPFRCPAGNGEVHFLHNPLAKHPVPRGWLPSCSEYWCEGSQLRCQRPVTSGA